MERQGEGWEGGSDIIPWFDDNVIYMCSKSLFIPKHTIHTARSKTVCVGFCSVTSFVRETQSFFRCFALARALEIFQGY